jgi:hypothetical protein
VGPESSDKILTIGQEFAKKKDFFPSRDFENALDFGRLKTLNSGTLFAIIQFLLAHSDWGIEETSGELANKER